jgi:AcrR family transcriptional regulator
MRDQQRAATESALVEAAWERCAALGPDGTSVRQVAADAGCNHALVARYFGSKDGLVEAVADRLRRRVDAAVEAATSGDADPVEALLAVARSDRPAVQLLVRSALGDLGAATCPATPHAWRVLAGSGAPAITGEREQLRHRLCVYGAASLLLGWLTYDRFVVAATGLGRLSGHRLDAAIAATARSVLAVAQVEAPAMVRPLALDRSLIDVGPPDDGTARGALVAAAVELFALHGPASVSVRDVARRAGVNQALIYRHLGSKQELIAAAFEQGSSSLFPAALSPAGFDLDMVSHQLHHGAPASRLIARIVVDGVDIAAVRAQFPILRRLLEAYDDGPQRATTAGPADPRVAVSAATCMAMGSAIYGPGLCDALGLPSGELIEAAIADLSRAILAAPVEPGGATAVVR